MKRCIYCMSECPENSESCTVCGFGGVMEKQFRNCLPTGTKLNNRYVLGGVFSKEKVFVSYYAFDTKTSQRVRITEYLNEKLVYRHTGELIIKYHNEQCLAQVDKEIAVYYTHYKKLCTASEKTALNFTDCFAENSTFYFVNSIDNGTPLSSLIGNGKTVSFSKAVRMLEPLFKCTSALEKVGKWHGSVSPYSILTENGKISSVTGYTYPPKNAYSPFDAPEKQLGAKECGPFTDVYAVSAILYEAVTGFLPPNAAQRAEGRKLRFPAGFPEKERAVIEKGLALDKSERYANTEEFYAALRGGKPTSEKLPRSEIVRRLTLAFAVLCFIVSGGILLNSYVIEPYKESKQSSDIVSMIQTTLSDNSVDPWQEIKSKHPDIDFPSGMNPAFADLYAANRDFAGWISIPDMNINYAVVQGKDNKEYERRDFYGNSTSYGVPFFDSRNSLHSLDRNTIIFGHNMRRDDKIFGTLEQYRTVEGFARAPIIGMSTLYGDYTFKIYAAFISNSDRDDDNGNFLNFIFTNTPDENFANYIAEIDKRKFYTTGVDINFSDKILTLSTCCYDFSDARLVVVGRLLREGESPAVDTSLAVMNPSPKLPQAYYDAKGEKNPYKDDINLFND
ncbi:MAG: sortase [Clostridia bacterium]|nr:sortase [Clostridia bacterium]